VFGHGAAGRIQERAFRGRSIREAGGKPRTFADCGECVGRAEQGVAAAAMRGPRQRLTDPDSCLPLLLPGCKRGLRRTAVSRWAAGYVAESELGRGGSVAFDGRLRPGTEVRALSGDREFAGLSAGGVGPGARGSVYETSGRV